ncbi:hypothetical protein B1A_06972, partial [mine drainage metagenome]
MASGHGLLKMFGAASGGSKIRLTLADEAGLVHQQEMGPPLLAKNGAEWKDLPVTLWWPNGHGEQKLYSLTCDLLDDKGQLIDRQVRTVGFRNIEWRKTKGA